MRHLTLILLFIFPMISIGQLVTNTGMSPAGLVQNVLLGEGVTVSNINYNGSPIAIGSFTANGTNLGISEGVILTTGTVLNSPNGPHGPNNSEGAGFDNGAPGYGLLSNEIGIQTYNAAILQFDFVPYSDSVRFNYVFASEEYLEYVNTGYNDVFGFYISGPGIAGLQNIARLPNGQIVAIDNVHAAGSNVEGNSFGPQNQQYYINNNGGNWIQYDGFTTVLTAESRVQCGETYHLIIALADAGDPVWDSGIFLEANSLSSNAPVSISHTISQDLFNNPTIIAEDCVTATITLERGPENINDPLVLPINLSGTATELVDYSDIPSSVTFPPGVSQVQFSFNAFQDALVEGPETIIMSLPIEDPCGNINPLILELTIEDVDPVEVEITGDILVCPGEEIELTANVNGGGPPYTYLWSTGDTTPSITVSPSSTQTYTVSVTDNCLNETASDQDEIVVPILQPLVANESSDITEICPYLPTVLEVNPSGGLAPYSIQWESNGEILGSTNSITVTPASTTTYQVTITDFCGNTTAASILYTITSPPLVLEMSPYVEICPGDSIQISVTPSGGYGQFYYDWEHSNESTPTIWVKPSNTTTYSVDVSDECQTFSVTGTTQVAVIKPRADFETTSSVFFNGLPITFLNTSENANYYEWTFGDGNFSDFIHPQNTYRDPGSYIITLIATDEKGCKDTIQKPINIEEEWYIYVPNAFTPDGNMANNVFKVSTIGIQQLEILIFNRWGELIFEAKDKRFIWDGTHNGVLVNDGTYTYKINIVTNSGREKSIPGHINVLK